VTKAERELVEFLERRNPGWRVEIEHRKCNKLALTARAGRRTVKCNAAKTTSDSQRHAYNVERKLRTKMKGYHDER
jgi:hypothetical protein